MKKILVIEDAATLRKDIVEMLSYEGYEVTGAEDGLVGIDRAKEFMPDLIICDIMMPRMDGYGVLEHLRDYPNTATVPFIFLTARTDRVDVRHGMRLGADDYLTKPFTADELIQSVKTRLERHEVITSISERKLEDLRGNIILALPHELRTPLNVILGFSDLLMMDFNVMEPARVGDMARLINTSGMRLYRLVENYLIYANIEILKSEPDKLQAIREKRVDHPVQVIEVSTRNKLQLLAREKAIEREADLVLELNDDVRIQISEEHLRKIVEELVDNAVKFSQPGTPVTVVTRREGSRFVIEVGDQGRGMKAEQIAKIGAYMQFERDYYEHQGSGMGLVISQRLAELYNGYLNVSPNGENGLCAKVYLTIAE
jgi:two-component system, sensor histidine kinase and response regulator